MSFRVVTFVAAIVVWVLASVISTQAQAQAQDHPAYDLVEDITERVLGVVEEADEYVEADPDRYYRQIQDLLDPLIDFRGFARKVMGPYASSERYRSLDEAGRQQLRDHLDRFTAVMRSSLVRTYSKGLLAFGGSRVDLVRPEAGEAGDKEDQQVSVRQLIYSDRKQPYVVMYQMGQEKSGEWMLRNVIIESVNLGEVYRDQFLASAREHDGNLDQVIAAWTIVTVEVES